MRAFFDVYVNAKITLKHFTIQYENALRDKVEKEILADFMCADSQENQADRWRKKCKKKTQFYPVHIWRHVRLSCCKTF
jgi:hypothetical protein